MKNKFLTKIVLLFLILCLTISLTGCGIKGDQKQSNSDDNSPSNSEQDTKTENKDLEAFDYMDKLNPENTVEEINAVMGSEGKLVDEKYNQYSWDITEDTKLTATYYSSKTATLEIDIDNDLLKDEKADLSCAKDLKSEINSTDGIKYEDFVSRIGCEGHIIEKSSLSTTYIWVNSDGGYLKGTFSNYSNRKCTFFSAFA